MGTRRRDRVGRYFMAMAIAEEIPLAPRPTLRGGGRRAEGGRHPGRWESEARAK
jgi:hypothetical protein